MDESLYSDRARQDLRDIVDLIAERRPKTAKRILAKLQATAEMLAEMPTLGAICQNRQTPNLRTFSVKGFVIYYRTEPLPVRVLRVVSGLRDAKSLDFE